MISINNVSSNQLEVIEDLAQDVTNELIDELFQLEEGNYDTQPASKHIIDNLKVNLSSKDSDSNCSICLDKIKKNDKVCKLDCDHEFHESCLKKWLKIDNSCPVCRCKLKCSELLKDFLFITIFYPDKSILYKSFNKKIKVSEFISCIKKYTNQFINPSIFIKSIFNNKILDINDIGDQTIYDLGIRNNSKIKIYY